MERTYLCLPFEYREEMDELTDEEFGRLIRGLLDYSMSEKAIVPVGNERFFVKRVMRTEDHFRACFEDKSQKRSASGKKAANARWKKNASASERMETHDDALRYNAENAPIGLCLGLGLDIDNKEEAKIEVVPKKEEPKETAFDRFWAVYPNKTGKGAARKAFAKIKGVPVEKMIDAVEKQKQSRKWTEENGKYIPNPATWLNQERWEDSVEVVKTENDDGYKMPTDFGDLDLVLSQEGWTK